jgi:hypothetical protein
MMPGYAAAQCSASPVGIRLEIMTVPPAGEGGPEETGSIAGTTAGVTAQSARLVIYAHSGDRWWVQPLAAAPFTEIRVDGQWQTTTHLGFEYAVLVVDKSYSPEAQRFTIPAIGGCVWALITVKGRVAKADDDSGRARSASKSVRFSGYDWRVKSGSAEPGPNTFSDGEENVRVDSDGRLHLRITYRDGRWYCAEVVNQRSLGYGTYQFVPVQPEMEAERFPLA